MNGCRGFRTGRGVALSVKGMITINRKKKGGEMIVKRADLRRANLSDANLSMANLRQANLSDANLIGADLGGADLSMANLIGADLRRANLSEANLRGADLRQADLSEANLSMANLRGADLSEANLSGSKGLLDPISWMSKFKQSKSGVIVYKMIGKTQYRSPDNWIIQPDNYLSEVCNPCRTSECACGVNFGTLEWCEKNYTDADLWECEIEWIDLAGVVVPYNTDGKARCSRLKLIKKL